MQMEKERFKKQMNPKKNTFQGSSYNLGRKSTFEPSQKAIEIQRKTIEYTEPNNLCCSQEFEDMTSPQFIISLELEAPPSRRKRKRKKIYDQTWFT